MTCVDDTACVCPLPPRRTHLIIELQVTFAEREMVRARLTLRAMCVP